MFYLAWGPDRISYVERLALAGNCQESVGGNLVPFFLVTLCLQTAYLRVEPRGFEPLTSAVQRRCDSLLEVSRVLNPCK